MGALCCCCSAGLGCRGWSSIAEMGCLTQVLQFSPPQLVANTHGEPGSDP